MTKAATKPEPSLAPPTIEEVQAQVNTILAKEIAENWTEDKIRRRVQKMLEENFSVIVKTQLGFSKSSWGGNWEVDHCNGRAGQTIVGDRIAAAAVQAVEDVIIKGCTEGKFKLSAADIKVMEKEFTDKVRGYEMRKRVEVHASKQMDRLFDLLNGKITGAQE